MRAIVIASILGLSLGASGVAHAGDRGLYLNFVELPETSAPDGLRAASEAMLTQLLHCEATPLPACRAAHARGSERFDTGMNVLLYDLPAAMTAELVSEALRNRRPAIRRLAPLLQEQYVDGVIVLESIHGRLFITTLYSSGLRAARVPVVVREGADAAAVWQRAIARALRPVQRRWEP